MARLTENILFAQRYTLQKRIGTGAFSEVWRAQDTATNSIIALKIYAPDKGIDEDGLERFADEYRKTADLNHAHVLSVRHFDVSGGSPYLVMTYCKGGALNNLIAKTDFLEVDVAKVMAQIGDSLAYIHQHLVDGATLVHQDVKPANILIKEPGNYMLTDFGISSRLRRTVARSVLGNNADIEQSNAHTPAYAPPEVNRRLPAPTSDVFSFGITLLELVLGKLPPYHSLGAVINVERVLPELPPIPARFSPDLFDLIVACLRYEPSERPTAAQLARYATYFLHEGHWNIDEKYLSSDTLSNPHKEPVVTEPITNKTPKQKTAEDDDHEHRRTDIIRHPAEEPVSKPLFEPINEKPVYENIKQEQSPPPPPPPAISDLPTEPIPNSIKDSLRKIDEQITKNTSKASFSSTNPSATNNGKSAFPKGLLAIPLALLAIVGVWMSGLLGGGAKQNMLWINEEIATAMPTKYRDGLSEFYQKLPEESQLYRLYNISDWLVLKMPSATGDSIPLCAAIVRYKNPEEGEKARLLLLHWKNDKFEADPLSEVTCRNCIGITAKPQTEPVICEGKPESIEKGQLRSLNSPYLVVNAQPVWVIYTTTDGRLALCNGK